MNDISILDRSEFGSQRSDGSNVKFVLVRFKIAELRELLATVIETTQVGLRLIVDNLVGADVPALGESFPTDFALVWAFSSVPSFVRLQISKLGETTATSRFLAWVRLYSSMGSLVDVKVCLLIEALSALLDCALVAFLAALRAAGFFLKILLRELGLTRFSRSIRSDLGSSLHVRKGTGYTYHRSTLIDR